ncbi:MAG: tryptophan 2,3-dioxygenase [Flavobacteriales bacterium]|nr:tryptophan 2,3-dioxygenase [Flavobacteriales bacterium]|tara:strand:- start:9242 stop:10210 length:969 start_codon:yes stop_codon:yes gene_type:complete
MNKTKILEKITDLSSKYSATGQDLYSYLDGLLISDYINYWNYINLETLLSIQQPKTDFPDENIFIIYHQITELYFKLCLLELEQINENGRLVLPSGEDKGWNKKINVNLFIEKMIRLNRYFKNLIDSFEIMINGMEKDQFLKFRMALLPSSGFQSAQFRMMELRSTQLSFLTNTKKSLKNPQYKNIYWKSGANEMKTGTKTYTLKQFEKKYDPELIKLSTKMKGKNLLEKYLSLSKKDQANSQLVNLLKEYDYNFNIHWKLAHYKSAAKYLKIKNKRVAATGGTNWEEYLPPRFQKIIFFPNLWSKEERNQWGRKWVESINI